LIFSIWLELHLAHRGIGLVGQRKHRELDEDGGNQDGDAEIADDAVGKSRR
jgi:hypothetical protein